MYKIHKIVLTGGPCSGKSSAVAFLREKLEGTGHFVITVPEAATLSIKSGFHPFHELVSPDILQDLIIGIGLGNESMIMEAAKRIAEFMPVVILFDRGSADSLAYISTEMYAEKISKFGLTLSDIYNRYDLIAHLVTAAIGAEQHFTCENNEARTETPEQARILDGKTLEAWKGHDQHVVIGNETDFDGKLQKVFAHIARIIGIPYEISCERKFLVQGNLDLLPDHNVLQIEQAYLPQSNGWMRIRKSTDNVASNFSRVWKRPASDAERIYTHELITAEHYHFLAGLKNASAKIQKDRHVILCPNIPTRFTVDDFKNQNALPEGYYLAEITTTDSNEYVDFSSRFDEVREVTGDPEFSNVRIAERIAA